MNDLTALAGRTVVESGLGILRENPARSSDMDATEVDWGAYPDRPLEEHQDPAQSSWMNDQAGRTVCDRLKLLYALKGEVNISIYERNILILPCPVGEVSDRFHTFDELYAHRQLLFVKLMNCHPDKSWKSRKHEDGSMYEGDWFVAGMCLPTGDVTYHLEGKYWGMAKVQEFNFAPAWDGHTAKDVLNRLSNWEQGI